MGKEKEIEQNTEIAKDENGEKQKPKEKEKEKDDDFKDLEEVKNEAVVVKEEEKNKEKEIKEKVVVVAAEFDAKQYVDDLVANNKEKVVIISKSFCPFCKEAKEVLMKHVKSDDIIKKEIDLDFEEQDMRKIQTYCKELTGSENVPRIFINGKCVGGCDDTKTLDKNGELAPLIKEK